MSDEIQALFDASRTPAPRADLADRIAAAAKPAAAAIFANDNRRLWPAFAAVAATLVAGLFVLLPSSEPAEEDWAQYAEAAGFSDLYDWVEGEG